MTSVSRALDKRGFRNEAWRCHSECAMLGWRSVEKVVDDFDHLRMVEEKVVTGILDNSHL
jgi:hypothetical protein